MSFAERTKSYGPAFVQFFRESQFSSSTVNVLDCSDFKICERVHKLQMK